MKGDFHVRFLERLGLKCSCLLDCLPQVEFDTDRYGEQGKGW